MNYTLHQLQVFLKVVQTQSITKASQELYLTQPAVSIQLKKLQDQFDVPLMEVVGRKIFITNFGYEIAHAAERIVEEMQKINYKTSTYKGVLAGKLKISVVSTGKYVMPFFLSGFIKKHDNIDLSMDVTNKLKVIQSLENNEVDFSLVSVMPEHLALNFESLLENELYLVGNKERKFSKRGYDKSIFKELPIIYRENGSGTRYTMEKFVEKNKISFDKKIELTSNEAVKQAIIAGFGYSIMPLIGLREELKSGALQIISVKGLPIKSEWRLVWLKEKKLSPVAAAYLEYLKQEKERVLKNNFNWMRNYH